MYSFRLGLLGMTLAPGLHLPQAFWALKDLFPDSYRRVIQPCRQADLLSWLWDTTPYNLETIKMANTYHRCQANTQCCPLEDIKDSSRFDLTGPMLVSGAVMPPDKVLSLSLSPPC